jgi:hypothetical protein
MEPTGVWKQFTEKLRSGEFGQDDCKSINGFAFGLFLTEPAHSAFRESIISAAAPTWEWGENKLIVRINEGSPAEVRFDFVEDNGKWLLYMVDAVTIPIRAIHDLPFDEFPPFDPATEAFLRAENLISFQVHVYQRIAQEKGKEEALSWLRDGRGKRVAASAWMPYFSAPKAFTVFIAWYERRLMGEEVSISEFSDERCVLRFHNHLWFKLYNTATHLRRQIAPEDYRELFESVWQDRAKESGWQASFEYAGHDTKVTLVPVEHHLP